MNKKLLVAVLLAIPGVAVFIIGGFGYRDVMEKLSGAQVRHREVTDSQTTVQQTPYGTVSHTTYWPGVRSRLDIDTGPLEARLHWMLGFMVGGGLLTSSGIALLLMGLWQWRKAVPPAAVGMPPASAEHKPAPGTVVSLLRGVPAAAAEIMLLVQRGLTLEAEGKWPEALKTFEAVLAMAHTDRVAGLAQERITELRRKMAAPPSSMA